MKYRGKYGLTFEGTLGEFIKAIRKTKKINSVDLSKNIGRSGAYVSQIESGRNKNPDYDALYEIFKQLGIEEVRIDDYLEHFGYLSPDYIAMDEAYIRQQEEQANDPEYQEHLIEQHIESYEQQLQFEEEDIYNYDWVEERENKIQNNIKEIEKTLSFFASKNTDTFESVIENLHRLVGSMGKDKENYDFFTTLFKNDLTDLDKDNKNQIIEAIKTEWSKPKTKGFGRRRPF